MIRTPLPIALLTLTLLASACGSSPDDSATGSGAGGSAGTAGSGGAGGGSGGQAGSGGGAPKYPAFLPSAPQVKSAGGHVLKNPKIVPIIFAGDADTTKITDFVSAFAGSAYWTTVSDIYDLGTATVATPVMVQEDPPDSIGDAEIQTWLAGHLDASTGDWGGAEAGAIYAVFYPTTTTFSLDGLVSCVNLGGYHGQTSVSAVKTTYAIIGRCATFQNLQGIDVMTAGASHELIESATDPDPNVASAFDEVDADHLIWELFPGAEVADMCDFMSGVYFKPPGLDAMVERVWSNKQAAAGHHPCAPAVKDEVYFNAIPVLDEDVVITAGASIATKGVKVAVGTSKTIDVGLLSDGPTAPWDVTAEVLYESSPTLSFVFDKGAGVNGDTLKLTITANSPGSAGGSAFRVKSRLGDKTNFWVGFVQN